MKFKAKPTIVEAWQWNGTTNWEEAPIWLQDRVGHWSPNSIYIDSAQGTGIIKAIPSYWFVKDIDNKVYVYEPNTFKLMYEEAK